jgi:Ca2+-binding RTX toxin-like protein
MSSSPQTLRYVFYGGVEGLYQNQDIDNPELASPQHGAAAFGYREGQLTTGYLSLSGEALAIATSVPRGDYVFLSPAQSGFEFFFEQPSFGSRGGYTQQDIDLNSSVWISLGAGDAPLRGLRVSIAEIPNPLILNSGTTLEHAPTGIGASVDGIWLPEHVKPVVASGTSRDDTLRGTAQYNFLSGADGNDTLFLKAGQGWMWGGFGDDYLKGGSKGDHLFGGYGNDKILGRSGNDVIRGGEGVDDLRGEQGKDTIDGGFGSDSVKGGSGDDTLGGQHGNDKLYGNDGRDTLEGGYGNDYLDAGSGDDWLFGGSGDDMLKGGSGRDSFWFSTVRSNNGRDTIVDFKAGTDRINIEGDLFETFQQMIDGNYAVQVGDDVQITYGYGTTSSMLTIQDIRLAHLRASDFGISPPG